MVKKAVKTIIEEEKSVEEIEEQSVEAPEPKPTKAKKVLTEKQMEALAKGREKGRMKLEEKHAIQNKAKAINKEVKELKQQELIKNTDDLKEFADVSFIRKSVESLNDRFSQIHNKFESIDNRFNGYLTERQQRKLDKQNNILSETIKKELPKTVNDLYMKQKIQKELSNNPFLGRV